MGSLKLDWMTVAIFGLILFILVRGFDIDKLIGKDRD